MKLGDRLANYASSVATFTRYVGTFAGGAAVAVGIFGLNAITPDQMSQLFAALNQLGTAVSSGLTALGTLASIATALYAAWKSSKSQQTKTVQNIPGVQVHVDTSEASHAPPQVKALVTDAKAEDVVPMTGGPVEK